MKKIITALLLLIPLVAITEETKTATPPTDQPIEQPATLPLNPQMESMPQTIEYESLFLKTILSLVAVIIFIIIVYYLIRKMSGFRSGKMNLLKSVKVLEKRPLSPKSMLYLIEVAGRQFLIAESQLEVRPITQLDWIDEEESD